MAKTKNAPTILIVDDESLFRESVIDTARAAHPDWRVLDATNGLEALAVLRKTRVEVLVTDLKMPELDGLGLLAALSEFEQLPRVIVVSAYSTEKVQSDLRQLGAVRCLDKPVDLPKLIEGIAAVLAAPASSLTGITVSGFVQLLELERKTCQLRLTKDRKIADLFFEDGQLVDAVCGGLHGDDAAFEVFDWNEAKLEILPTIGETPHRITAPLRHLLLEAAQRCDERAVEDDLMDFGAWGVESSGSGFSTEVLESLMELDGAVAAALVDSNQGTTIGHLERGLRIDLSLVAQEISAVVLAEQNVIERLSLNDNLEAILVTLGEQYHLIHVAPRTPERFLCLVLDRDGANLMLAKQRLAETAATL